MDDWDRRDNGSKRIDDYFAALGLDPRVGRWPSVGNDALWDQSGNDTLSGGPDGDYMNGGYGTDWYSAWTPREDTLSDPDQRV